MRPVLAVFFAILAVSCADDAIPERAFDPEGSPPTGVLVSYGLGGGECASCGWTLTLEEDGTATFATEDDTVTFSHDAQTARAMIAALDPSDLITGRADCGREVDGDAPTLRVRGVGLLDGCYATWDSAHPLLVHLESVREAAQG